MKFNRQDYRLIIENIGDSEARNIILLMDGKPFEDHPVSVEGNGTINVIGAHSYAKKLLALTLSRRPPFKLEISWEDNSGESGHYRTTLTF
jgi:hypothetical protein